MLGRGLRPPCATPQPIRRFLADIEVRTDGGKLVLDVRGVRGVTAALILSEDEVGACDP